MTYDPAIPLVDTYTPNKIIIKKNTRTPIHIAAVFKIAWTWKLPRRPSTEEWIKKMWSTQPVGYYSAMKKNKIMPFATTRMDLAMITLREISQTEKHKYHKLSLICGISKKKDTNKLIYKAETDSLTQKTNFCLPKGKDG